MGLKQYQNYFKERKNNFSLFIFPNARKLKMQNLLQQKKYTFWLIRH